MNSFPENFRNALDDIHSIAEAPERTHWNFSHISRGYYYLETHGVRNLISSLTDFALDSYYAQAGKAKDYTTEIARERIIRSGEEPTDERITAEVSAIRQKFQRIFKVIKLHQVAEAIEGHAEDRLCWSLITLEDENPQIRNLLIKKLGGLPSVVKLLSTKVLSSYFYFGTTDSGSMHVVARELLSREEVDFEGDEEDYLNEHSAIIIAKWIRVKIDENELDYWIYEDIANWNSTVGEKVKQRIPFNLIIEKLDDFSLQIFKPRGSRSKRMKEEEVLKRLYPNQSLTYDERIRMYSAKLIEEAFIGRWTYADLKRINGGELFKLVSRIGGVSEVFPYLKQETFENYRTSRRNTLYTYIEEIFRRDNINFDKSKIEEYIDVLLAVWLAEDVDEFLAETGLKEWNIEIVEYYDKTLANRIRKIKTKHLTRYLSTVSLLKLASRSSNKVREEELAKRDDIDEVKQEYDLTPPIVRSDCEDYLRPCPWECRYRLSTDFKTNCALDIADANPDGMTLEEVGELFNLTRERIRQIEAKALRTLEQRGINAKNISLEFQTDVEAPIVSLLDFATGN